MKQHFLLVLTILFFSSVTVSNIVVHKRDFVQRWAYRCNTKVFTPEFLSSTAEDLKRRIREDLTGQSYAPYISTVDPAFAGIVDEDGFPLMWPLLSPKQRLEKHGHKAVNHVILGSKNYRLLNVIHKQLDGTIVKCVVERDLTELSNNQIATGFRCPINSFSFEAIKLAIQKASSYKSKNVEGEVYHPLPFRFDENSLFDYHGQLHMAPMLENGKLNNKALTSFITNDSQDIIGMVHRRQLTYIRCRLTASTKVEPKFIGLLPELTNPMDKVVFHCNGIHVGLDTVIGMAADAIEGFKLKKKQIRNKYPALISRSPHEDSLNLYLWPVLLDDYERLVQNTYYRYKTHVNFLLINDFSDIIDVVFKEQGSNYFEPEISDLTSCARTVNAPL